VDLRKLARGRCRASARRASSPHRPHRRNRAAAAKRRRHNREAGWPHVGSSQRFTMDWSNIDGSTENIVLGESGNPLSPTSATSGTTGMEEPLSRCPSHRQPSRRKPAHPALAAVSPRPAIAVYCHQAIQCISGGTLPMSRITVDKSLCIQDGACVEVCGPHALALDQDGFPEDVPNSSCILCGHCVAVCSCNALTHAGLPARGSRAACPGADRWLFDEPAVCQGVQR
jgi:NAD-dependent dihydropyrimidine dehydrogenase PreA subunit